MNTAMSPDNYGRSHTANDAGDIPFFYWFVAAILCFGYILMGRGFAGIHIPGIPFYCGEFLIVLSLAWFFNQAVKNGVNGLQIFYFLIFSAFCGLFLFHASINGFSLDAVRDFASVYYMVFLFCFSASGGYNLFFAFTAFVKRFHLLLAAAFFFRIVLEPFLATFLVVGNDAYGLFFTPGCAIVSFAVLVLVITLEFDEKEKFRGSSVMISQALCLVTIALSQSRGAIVGAILALGVYLLFLSGNTWRPLLRNALVGFIVLLLFIPILPVVQQNLFSRSETEFSEFHVFSAEMLKAKFKTLLDKDGEDYKGGTGEGRIVWWTSIVQKNMNETTTFMIGQGFGYNMGEAIDYGKEGTRGAHNSIICMFAWSGIAGVLLYLPLFIVPVWQFCFLGGINSNPYIFACRNTGLTFLISVFVCSMFDNTLSGPVTCVPFFIITGSILSCLRYCPPHGDSDQPEPEETIGGANL